MEIANIMFGTVLINTPYGMAVERRMENIGIALMELYAGLFGKAVHNYPIFAASRGYLFERAKYTSRLGTLLGKFEIFMKIVWTVRNLSYSLQVENFTVSKDWPATSIPPFISEVNQTLAVMEQDPTKEDPYRLAPIGRQFMEGLHAIANWEEQSAEKRSAIVMLRSTIDEYAASAIKLRVQSMQMAQAEGGEQPHTIDTSQMLPQMQDILSISDAGLRIFPHDWSEQKRHFTEGKN